MEVGPTAPLHDGRRAGGCRRLGHRGPRPVRRGRGRRRAARRQPAGRQLAVRPPGLRAARGSCAPREYAKSLGGTLSIDEPAPGGDRRARCCALRSRPGPRIRTPFTTSCRRRCSPTSASSASSPSWSARCEKIGELPARLKRVRVEGHRQYNPGWHLALDLRSMLTVCAEAVARAAIERKESRGGHARDDYPKPDPALRQGEHGRAQAGRQPARCRHEPLPEMPEELKSLLEG